MALISLPYSFVAGQVIFSGQVNLNFSTIYAAFNGGIDSTNISPTVGIGANYIVASGSGATGLFTPGSYTFTSASTGAVPLVLSGITGQTAQLQMWEVQGVGFAEVDALGNFYSFYGGFVGSSSSYPIALGISESGVYPALYNDEAANGLAIVFPSTATNGTTIYSSVSGTNTAVATFLSNQTKINSPAIALGNVTGGANITMGPAATDSLITFGCSGTTNGYITLGSGTPATFGNYITRGNRDTFPYLYGVYNGNCHMVTGSVSVTFSGGPPSTGSTSVTISTAGQSFTSSSSYFGLAGYAGASGNLEIFGFVVPTSGTTFTVYGWSPSGATGTTTLVYFLIGS